MKKENEVDFNKGFAHNEITNLSSELQHKETEINRLREQLKSVIKREEISRLILMINTPGHFYKYMSDLTDALQEWSACEAVGIRLKQGNDYPYFETRGFPSSFIQAENKLCKYRSDGTPELECMCGNILCGRTDPNKSFFTLEGSFWSNNTTDLLASTNDSDRQARTRNRCNSSGYESVALIPLRSNKEIFGLLQFNDHRTNRFTPEIIGDLEKIANCISFALLRRKAEEDLNKSEHKWVVTLSSIGDAVIATDKTGCITFLNPVAEKLTGWKLEDALNQNAESILNIFKENPLRESERGKNCSLMLIRKDGSEIPVEMIESRINNKEDEISGTVILFRDIPLRDKAEAELKEKEVQFRNLADSGLTLIWTSDENKLCNYFNHTWLAFTGRTLEQEMGQGWIDGVHPEDLERCFQTYTSAFDNRSKFDMEYRLRHVSGEYRWIRDLGTPNFDSRGEFIGYIGHCFDISVDKLSENILRENEQHLKSLLEQTQKQKNEIQIQNERLESLLRISHYKMTSRNDLLNHVLKEAIDLTFSQVGYIFSYDESEKILTLNALSSGAMEICTVENPKTEYDLNGAGLWGEPIRQGRAIVVNEYEADHESKRGTPEGHVILHRFLTIPVIIDNVIVGVVGVANKNEDYEPSDVRQLTLLMDAAWRMLEHEKVVENLKIAKEKAEEGEKLKSAFLANMSHEIRTPMNGILGFAELLKEPGLSGEEKEEYIGIIEKSGRRMLNIINDIISISKLESGLMQVSLKETNINDQINYIHTFFRPEAEKKGINIFCFHDLLEKEAIINTDREKLYAILTNLVKNAIKFTWQGSIEIGYHKKDKFLEFYVRDTGNGIPPEQLDIIFERFRQGNESLTRNYEGAGLGLSISKAYVEMLGGKIWVSSSYGKGSCFYFTIPYTSEVCSDRGQISQNHEIYLDRSIADLKILIAEDDDLSDFLLRKAVKPYAKEILRVRSGNDAIAAVSRNPDIDLILMDIKMPEVDGYNAIKKIREFNENVIIIVQTAFSLTVDKEKAMKSGCNDYISKPIRQVLLRQKIEDIFYSIKSKSVAGNISGSSKVPME